MGISRWAQRELRLTDEQLQALRHGCPDLDESAVPQHTKSCATCTRTLLNSSARFSEFTIVRLVSLDLLMEATRPAPSLERFTEFVPCPYCDTEIFATRWRGTLIKYWSNRLDRKPHTCADFRDAPVEVSPWRRGRRHYVAGRSRRIDHEEGKRHG